MEKIFIALTGAVEGTPAIALGASFLWGVLSLVLSPCHLSSIPLIVGFIDEQGRTSPKRAFCTASVFSSGIMISIGLIGLVTATAGRMMGDVGRYGNYFVAFIFFLVGLHLVGVIPMPWSGPGNINMKRRGLLAAFILGAVFGVALGPCTFAYMAPMLSITFQLSATKIWYGILLLLVYAVGHCSIIVLAGTFTEAVQNYLNWNERSMGARIVKIVCGVLVICGGIYLVYTA
ncbi:MAG: Cytochrome C biogenesis protein transmembrane region [Syntrophorhabdus sp. PtaB.Bin047]|nr:MAG: Cytochrome C biogenesis protein transmembrane region [Syntrophorhabdus sp. PtaB.Bin047]